MVVSLSHVDGAAAGGRQNDRSDHDRWRTASMALTERQERAAWQAVEDAGGVEAFQLIVLSGSLAAGYGHGYSDVDLYVVPTDGVRAVKRARAIVGEQVQLNPVAPETMARIAATFSAYRVTPAERGQLFEMRPLLREAGRLAFGRLLHATDRFEAMYRACDRHVIRRLVMTDCAREVGRHAEDAAGGLAVGDPLIALQAAEVALRFAGEAVLAARGDVYVGESFFWRRLARVDTDGALARHLWRLIRHGLGWGAPLGDVAARVDRMLDLAGYLVSRAQLDAWDDVVDEFPLPEPAGDTGPGALRRAPAFSVLRFGDTFSIVGPDKAYRSDAATVRRWLDVAAAGSPDAGTQQFVHMGLLVPRQHDTEGGEPHV